MWVSVEAGVLPVEPTVNRLRPRLSVSVEAAGLSVGGIRERLWIGIAATYVGVGGGESAVGGVDSGLVATMCVGVGGGGCVLSRRHSRVAVDRLCYHTCGCRGGRSCLLSRRHSRVAVDRQCDDVCGCRCRWRRLSSQSTVFESGSGSRLRPRVWVMVEAGVLPVESTVDRLRPRVWLSVEVAVFSVDGIREWQCIGIPATRAGVGVDAAVFSVDGIREGQWIGIAATCVGVGVGRGGCLLSRRHSRAVDRQCRQLCG